ncbi:hypothetical protein PFISCL1PPCAC_20328, partial [Pristionchus fissidentatus]
SIGDYNVYYVNYDLTLFPWERVILKIGVISFIMTFPGLLLQILLDFWVYSAETTLILYYQLGWVIDMKSFCSPIIMILINVSLRREVMRPLNLVSFRRSPDIPMS